MSDEPKIRHYETFLDYIFSYARDYSSDFSSTIVTLESGGNSFRITETEFVQKMKAKEFDFFKSGPLDLGTEYKGKYAGKDCKISLESSAETGIVFASRITLLEKWYDYDTSLSEVECMLYLFEKMYPKEKRKSGR